MKNILITGGAGFIGSTLIRELLKRENYKIFVLDIKENPINLKSILGKIDYINGDIRNKEIVNSLFNSIDFAGVINFAAVSRVIWGHENPNLCVSTNIDGTKTLMDAISKSKKKSWVIFGSSREVYGEQTNLPVKESANKVPINIYGKTKLEGENIVINYSKKSGISSIILRFSNVYGNERDILDRVIPNFVLRALRGENLEIHGGKQIFDFTHVDDTVQGIILAIEHLEKNDYALDDFHILTGQPTKLIDLPQIISKYIKKDVKIKFTKARNYDVEKFYGDPSKAKDILGFNAKIDIDKGIEITVNRFKKMFV